MKRLRPGKASRYGLRNYRRKRKHHHEGGDIMLPPGKIPFVMSQDDLCYYPYMDGDGFANRIVIGEDGKPTCQMTLDDGTVTTGDYDLVPILEKFCEHHPDFSYKGATGCSGLHRLRGHPRLPHFFCLHRLRNLRAGPSGGRRGGPVPA